MKRDWDVIREILLRLEQAESANAYLNVGHFSEFPEQQVAYNMRLLQEAGAIEAHISESHTGDGHINGAIATRLTWKGHELLDSIRNESVWTQVKGQFKEKGLDMTVDLVLKVAKEIMSKMLGV